MTKREEFLAGDRPEDVAFFLHEDAVDDVGALSEYAETVPEGVVLVLPGEQGRSAFKKAAGQDPMQLAQAAMETEGTIRGDRGSRGFLSILRFENTENDAGAC